MAPLDRFQFGQVELEVSQIGKECHGSKCAIFEQVGKCVMPAEGIFARVVHGGTLAAGDQGLFVRRRLRLLVITLSDRAAAGVYEDRSGPRSASCWRFSDRQGWHLEFPMALIPDDATGRASSLGEAIRGGVDVVFTTGGTGVGPRDITPDTVAPLCDKFIPGIMEQIRTSSARRSRPRG